MLDRFKVPEDIAVRIPPAMMHQAVVDIFVALGMPEANASQGADTLLYADVRGIDSHGVSNMMRAYVAGLKGGSVNPDPQWKATADNKGAVNIDSDKGLGIVVGPHCMRLAIERAREYGVAIVTAHNGGHYGAAAYHAHLALEADMIGISMTTGGVLVTPTQGAEPLLGLNPIGIAAPTAETEPYLFDASMSSVAANKIGLLRRVGGQALPGWVSGPDGAPIMEETDVPDDFMMLPLGGTREIGSHKGYGMMMFVEILTSLLAGSGGGPLRRDGSAHCFMAINVGAFGDAGNFKADMDAYNQRLLDCKPAPGETRVVYAGVPEQEAATERNQKGIPYHPDVIEWFRENMDELGVAQPFN
tara:strand:+ start:1664 stop:2740 length:1077 start_codon:yes stop_codon:yes gene_type:complete